MDVYEIRRKNARMLASTLEGAEDTNIATLLANRLAKSRTMLSEMLRGKRNIGAALARDVEHAFDRTHGWLDMIHTEVMQNLHAALPDAYMIPIIDIEHTRYWGTSMMKDKAISEHLALVPQFPVGRWAGKNSFALSVMGDAMLPSVQDGDLVIIDPDIEPRPGDRIVVELEDGTCLHRTFRVKQMRADGDYDAELVADNQNWPTVDYERVTRLIGTEVAHTRLRRPIF